MPDKLSSFLTTKAALFYKHVVPHLRSVGQGKLIFLIAVKVTAQATDLALEVKWKQNICGFVSIKCQHQFEICQDNLLREQ